MTDDSQKKFNKAVIQHFFKAPVPRSHPGYGMPRPDTGEVNPFRLLPKDMHRDPSIVSISNYPDLTTRSGCVHSKFYCDILGPSACGQCIESTNRHIGDELQRILFPQIEMSRTKLVKPKLAKVMRDGHLQTNRRRRLKEISFPADMDNQFPMKRQETNLLMASHARGPRPSFASTGSNKHSSYSVSSRTTHLTTVKEEIAIR